MEIDEITGIVVDAAVKIHRDLGRDLFESVVVDRLIPPHRTQLLTYLRLANLPVGLLLNFGAPAMKDGIKRLVNGAPPSASSPLRVNRPRDS